MFAAVFWAAKFYPGMHLLPWQWLLAFSSHHVRDATRRGLWLVPGVWSTKPLPYWLYVSLVLVMPPLLAQLAPFIQVPPTSVTSRTFVV